MFVVYFFVSYLVLALAIPLVWSLASVWRKTRQARPVTCPDAARVAIVRLDSWHAVKMRAAGNPEFRVLDCSQWPQRRNCARECLIQLGG